MHLIAYISGHLAVCFWLCLSLISGRTLSLLNLVDLCSSGSLSASQTMCHLTIAGSYTISKLTGWTQNQLECPMIVGPFCSGALWAHWWRLGCGWKFQAGLPAVFCRWCCLLRDVGSSPQGLSPSNKLDQLSYRVVLGNCFNRTNTEGDRPLNCYSATPAAFHWSKKITVTAQM